MKRTYIFKLGDNELSPVRLAKLVNVLTCTDLLISWKYGGASDEFTSVQVFAHEPTVVQICFDAGWNTSVIPDAIAQARRRGDAAVGRAKSKLNELRRRHARKEQKRTYIFIQGKDGVTYRAIDDMREAMGLRVGNHINRWEVRVNPKEMFDASRAAGVPGSAVVFARQRAYSLHERAMHGIRYSTPVVPEDTVLLDWLEKTQSLISNNTEGAHICYPIPSGGVEHFYGSNYRDVIRRAMRHTQALNALHSRRLERAMQMPGGTKRSKRSA